MCLALLCLGESSVFGMCEYWPLSAVVLTKRTRPLAQIVKFEAVHIDITVCI